MTTLREQYHFCAFADVLGYKHIVTNPLVSTERKIKILEDIYRNMFHTASWPIGQINKSGNEKIFIKSFSDCLYLQSTDAFSVLFTLYNFFNKAFGFNHRMGNEPYTPLIRAGVVNDWTVEIMDAGSLARHGIDGIAQTKDHKNIVGLGVARAYGTSEQHRLSGMRIIISPEVLKEIALTKYEQVSFECNYFDCTNYLHDPQMPTSSKSVRFYLLPIRENENGEVVNLYELCWPVFKYEFSKYNSDIDILINELIKMELNFHGDSVRHLQKTAALIYKSLIITLSENQ